MPWEPPAEWEPLDSDNCQVLSCQLQLSRPKQVIPTIKTKNKGQVQMNPHGKYI